MTDDEVKAMLAKVRATLSAEEIADMEVKSNAILRAAHATLEDGKTVEDIMRDVDKRLIDISYEIGEINWGGGGKWFSDTAKITAATRIVADLIELAVGMKIILTDKAGED